MQIHNNPIIARLFTVKEAVIATTNAGKAKEFNRLLSNFDLHVHALNEYPAMAAPAETGKTFKDNALIKAQYYSQHLQKICVADDSGLEVEALNDFPGVYSARVAEQYGGYPQAVQAIFQKLAEHNIQVTETRARFHCCIVLYDDQLKDYTTFEGKLLGTLQLTGKGDNGFGYDPFFKPHGHSQTFAEMTMDEKNSISHRAIAANQMITNFCQFI